MIYIIIISWCPTRHFFFFFLHVNFTHIYIYIYIYIYTTHIYIYIMIVLFQKKSYNVASLSIDDFYLPYHELQEIAQGGGKKK